MIGQLDYALKHLPKDQNGSEVAARGYELVKRAAEEADLQKLVEQALVNKSDLDRKVSAKRKKVVHKKEAAKKTVKKAAKKGPLEERKGQEDNKGGWRPKSNSALRNKTIGLKVGPHVNALCRRRPKSLGKGHPPDAPRR